MRARLREVAALAGPRSMTLLALGAALGLGLAGIEIAFAFTLQAFLSEIGAMSPGTVSWPAGWPRPAGGAVYGLILAIGASRAVLVGVQVYLQGAAGEELKLSLRERLLQRIFRARSASSSEAMTLFTARADAFGAVVGAAQFLSTQALLAVLLLGGLFALAPALTAMAVGLAALASLPLRLVDRTAQHTGESLNAEWQRVTERMLSSMRNLLLLQILGTQEREREAAVGHLRRFHRHILSFYTMMGLNQGAPQALGLGALVAAAGWAGKTGALMPGTLVTFFYLFLRLVQVGSQASQSMVTLAHYWPQIRDTLAWARRPEDALFPSGRSSVSARRVGWRLRAAAVRYLGASRDALAALDLDLEAGQCLVVTGESGSGKSTLLALLLGLLDPSAGRAQVILDGEAVEVGNARGRLLPLVGYVGPDTFMIEGTLRDNLRYGLEHEPPEAEVEAALAAAECGFLKSLPDGLAHRLTEQGQGLSAGQKQRLALARALLRRPAVLFLDEATSNLDGETEARIVETLLRLKGSMTIVAVSHRPALLALADQRVLLDGGVSSPG